MIAAATLFFCLFGEAKPDEHFDFGEFIIAQRCGQKYRFEVKYCVIEAIYRTCIIISKFHNHSDVAS